MKKGKFIVIEGTDGSGKATQIEFLKKRLAKEGKKLSTADFPQYGKPSAYFVEKYLRGEYGTAEEVGPFRGSLFFAVDRYDASFSIRKWIEEGKIVLSNRYVSANMGHQAGKIPNLQRRNQYLKWLDMLEYEIFGIPKPDMTILLYMPPEMGQKLVDSKKPRKYTKGKKRDIHEADISHLKKASEAYLYVAKKFGWTVIHCVEKGKLLSREEIHKKVYEAIKKLLY